MSPAPYAHQWHTNPMILGLNLSPVLIRSHLFWSAFPALFISSLPEEASFIRLLKNGQMQGARNPKE